MTIQEIITHKEDQTFDSKSIQVVPKVLVITIVAFANAGGGVIFIGVSDKTWRMEGMINSG
jgi:toxin-antitoxin system, toxin component, fic family